MIEYGGPASNVDCRYRFLSTAWHPTGSTVVSASPTSTPVFHAVTSPGTSISPSATTDLLNITICSKYRLINDIAYEKNLSASSDCPTKVFSSDQIAIVYCNSSTASWTWNRGPKVLDVCESLPHFTPIATFTNEQFSTLTNTAAIFLGCAGNGFKAAIALCNKALSIVHVDGALPPSGTDTIPNPDPRAYYVVLS